MPIAAIGVGLGTAISGSAAAGATVYGAQKQSSAATKAGNITANSAAEALAYQKQQDAIERQQYLDEQTYTRQQDERDRAFRDQQAAWTQQQRQGTLDRLAPYRDFGQQGMSKLAALL